MGLTNPTGKDGGLRFAVVWGIRTDRGSPQQQGRSGLFRSTTSYSLFELEDSAACRTPGRMERESMNVRDGKTTLFGGTMWAEPFSLTCSGLPLK